MAVSQATLIHCNCGRVWVKYQGWIFYEAIRDHLTKGCRDAEMNIDVPMS